MLHAGLDLSRRRVDVCLIDERGKMIAETAAAADGDGLRGLAERLRGERVRAVIESMTGARFVHDTLEECGWEVLVADAQNVEGLAPLACKTDKIEARVLATLSHREARSGRTASPRVTRMTDNLAACCTSASGAERDAWSTYYYWLDDERAPDFARQVETHRKPGYDPAELFFDPAIGWSRRARAPPWRARSSVSGYVLGVVPLDPSLRARDARAVACGGRGRAAAAVLGRLGRA